MWAWGTVVVSMAALGGWLSLGQAADLPQVKPQQLIPADPLIYVSTFPSGEYQSAYEKTASHDALYKSGLMAAMNKLVTGIVRQIPAEQATEIQRAFATVIDKGMTLAVWVPADAPSPVPALTLVLHDARSLEKTVTASLTAASENAQVKITESTKGGRTIRGFILPETPGFQLSWWVEGEHLVLVAGMTGADPVLALAEGKTSNITTNPLWKKYRETPADPEQVLSAVAWVDLPQAVKTYGKLQIPTGPKRDKPLFVSDVLELLSLNEAGPLVMQSGYRGKTTWSVTTLEYRGSDDKAATPRTISLTDLPPLPFQTHTFAAGTVDLAGFYKDLVARVRRGAAVLAPPDDAQQVEETLKQLPELLGFDPQADLFDCLGQMYCFYQSGSLLQSSAAIVVEVRDAERLKKTIEGLQARIPERAPVRITRTQKEGRELVTLSASEAFVGFTYTIDKKWLVLAADPQTVQAFLLRLDGKLDHWKPTAEHSEAFAAVPSKFRSIFVSDPRGGLDFVVGLAPLLVGAAETFANLNPRFPIRLPISQIDLPPVETVSKPLFPNVTVTVSDSKKWQSISRESLSVNANGGMVTIGAAAVGAAILLPAVQQAREAARRTESRNYLRQIGLAAFNYESSFRQFPPNGNDPRRQKLKPEERLGWQADILPFLEQNNVYNRLDFSKPWDSNENKPSAQTIISVLQNPALGGDQTSKVTKDGYGAAHYVGNGGIGADGPTLDAANPKAGFFGFNRKTTLGSIKDGISNTVMASEAYQDFGPWAANTSATIRPLTKKPYIHGPDGFGNPNTKSGNMTVLMGDGAARTISKTIDPAVLEALYTINGGERVGEF
jgi:type II secretory pathway pseudopilin PulG